MLQELGSDKSFTDIYCTRRLPVVIGREVMKKVYNQNPVRVHGIKFFSAFTKIALDGGVT